MIFQSPRLTAQEQEVLSRIDQLRDELGYAVREPRRWTGLLRRSSLARAIRGSNMIEGYNVSIDDAMAAAENEEPLEAAGSAWAAVSGYREAMTYVLQLADDPHFSYSSDLLRSLHYMMLKYDLSKSPGLWRPGHVAVTDGSGDIAYEGPDAGKVPSLVAALIDELNSEHSQQEHRVLAAGMAHLNLVCIHPFRDGNGRMSRCLQTLVLARRGTLSPTFSSIEEYLGNNTPDYYRVLREVGGSSWNPAGDARPWVRFCMTAHYRQARTLLRRTRITGRVWDELERIVERVSLHERTILALHDAALGFRVRSATYRPAADISNQVASRDLKSLVDVGLLVPHGERKGRFYTGSDALLSIARKAARREPKNIADPFEEFGETERQPKLPLQF